MDVSVIIPTFGRAEKLGRCVARLARQTFERTRFEVLVGVDGKSEEETEHAVHEIAARSAGSVRCSVFQFEHAGPGTTRNRLVERSAGKLLLLLNDDVLPEPDLIERHVEAHATLGRLGGGAMILGAAPWVVPADDTAFDRLIRETSMIFFYDRMDRALANGEVQANCDWGFRHAWSLNLSLFRDSYCRIEFDPRLRFAMYEDLEFAYTMQMSMNIPVIYRPSAVVHHDHRIDSESYLRRERALGRAAYELAIYVPECAREIFRAEIRSDEYLEECRAFVDREHDAAAAAREEMRSWERRTSDSVTSDDVRAMYERHLVAKRWEWRVGLLERARA